MIELFHPRKCLKHGHAWTIDPGGIGVASRTAFCSREQGIWSPRRCTALKSLGLVVTDRPQRHTGFKEGDAVLVDVHGEWGTELGTEGFQIRRNR